MTGMYGLPLDVQWCRLCTSSNQRMASVVERDAKPDDAKPTLGFTDGICDGCRYAELRKVIDWESRERQLRALCNTIRSKRGNYDCIVNGSGGKDSIFAAHVLKTKYGMHPLTVTTAPIIPTEIGRKNFDAWTRIADNILFTPGDRRAEVRRDFLEYLHPFRSFIRHQRECGPRLSKMTGIDTVWYGENPAERNGPLEANHSPLMERRFFDASLPTTEVRFLSYYVPWKSQANYYYAVENCGFTGNDQRTQGSYSKMSSLDDAVDPWHYFTTLCKTGLGRASYNTSEDIRDEYITREEGIALVRKYDAEFPTRYHEECLNFVGISDEDFTARCDAGRSPHLWEWISDGPAPGWALKSAVWT